MLLRGDRLQPATPALQSGESPEGRARRRPARGLVSLRAAGAGEERSRGTDAASGRQRIAVRRAASPPVSRSPRRAHAHPATAVSPPAHPPWPSDGRDQQTRPSFHPEDRSSSSVPPGRAGSPRTARRAPRPPAGLGRVTQEGSARAHGVPLALGEQARRPGSAVRVPCGAGCGIAAPRPGSRGNAAPQRGLGPEAAPRALHRATHSARAWARGCGHGAARIPGLRLHGGKGAGCAGARATISPQPGPAPLGSFLFGLGANYTSRRALEAWRGWLAATEEAARECASFPSRDRTHVL